MTTQRKRPSRPAAPATGPMSPKSPASRASDAVAVSKDSPGEEEYVRVAAYFLAEQRGFGPGHELADWLAAEAMLCAASNHSAAARSQASTHADTASPRATRPRSQSLQQPGESA